MANTSVRVRLHGQALEFFDNLERTCLEQQKSGKANSPEMQLLKSIRQKLDFLRIFPEAGDQISRRLIPKFLDASNLFKINLAGYNRMLYSIKTTPEEVRVFVLLIIPHPEYDKIFGYRKR